jgi:putative transposase
MPRRPRIDYAGALQHIAVRGNLQERMFADDSERWLMLELLAKTSGKYEWRCLSYVLMTNHVHFVVETAKATLAAGMCWLNTTYSKRMHDRRGRNGHMLRNRYSSAVVETEEHALELTRYLPLNPVRAGLAEHPEDYRWSSHAAEVGVASVHDCLKPGWATGLHGSVDALRAFVAAGMP